MIRNWLMEGYTVAEVYHRCSDHGFPSPNEVTLFRMLKAPDVQEVLKERREREKGLRIASLVERSKVRNDVLERIESVIADRADTYGGKGVPGGASGLVVLTEVKSVIARKSATETDYDQVEIHKVDTGLISELRQILNDQDESDDRLRRSLRMGEEHRIRVELMEQSVDLNEQQRELVAIEVEQARSMVDERIERNRASEVGAETGDPSLPDNERTY